MSDSLPSSVPVVASEPQKGVKAPGKSAGLTRAEYDAIVASLESIRKTLRELRDERGVHPADLPTIR